MNISAIKTTIKSSKRLADIVKVLTKFGFREFLVDTGLDRLHGLLKEDAPENDADRYADLPKAVRVRMILEELGPTFIKLGQLLSTRPDLIPAEWAEELKRLQDDCTQVSFERIQEVLEEEFPGRLELIFASIDPEPLAAASMAQVHRARFLDHSEVVLKILKPGTRRHVEDDMALVESLAQFVENYFSGLGYSPIAVAKEFSRELSREVNLIYEGQATDRLRHYFDDDDNINFPKVYWRATTRNVLALEEIKGQLISTLSPESLTAEERRVIVANGTDAVFKQCLRFGFFHADPHPGNIILQPGNKICFIDCGMTGQLDKKTANELVDLVAGIIRGDIDRLCRVVIELTDIDPAIIERRDFRVDLQHFVNHFQNADLQHLDITKLLADFFEMLQRYHIRCPGDLILLTKALTTIEAVAEHFDPTFNVLEHVEPEIREIVTRRYGISALRDRMMRTMTGYLELLEDFPGDIQRFLDYVRHSHFTLNLELKRIEHLADKIDLSSRTMGMAMIIAALIVGSSILILAEKISQEDGFIGTLGILGLITAGIYSAGFVASFLLPKKKK